MKQKELIAVIGLGAGAVIGAAAYLVAKKKKQKVGNVHTSPKPKHSHIRKTRHAHEPDFSA